MIVGEMRCDDKRGEGDGGRWVDAGVGLKGSTGREERRAE